MKDDRPVRKIKSFPYEGVYFILPENIEVTKGVEFPDRDGIGRIVMQFEFAVSDTDEKANPSDPVIEMWVGYNSHDVFRAGGSTETMELRINKGHGWKKMEPVDMISEADDVGGYGVVNITPDDPAVGWFP
jgi:hypothetical protein